MIYLNDEYSIIEEYLNDYDEIGRITLSAGNKNKGILPTLSFSFRKNNYTFEKIEKGCNLHLSEVKKSENSIILRHKTSNYLENYFLLQTAIGNGFDDVLFTNSKGQITETSKCNIFFVKNGTLYTPNLSCGLLHGIIRSWLIDRANACGIKCIIGNFNTENLLDADEVFLTNSAMGIMHTRSIDKKIIGLGNAGEITKLFKEKLSSDMECN